MSKTKIITEGNMYETMFIELTKAQFDDIAKNGQEADSWAEVEDEIYGGSRINGYTFDKEQVNFTVDVNGDDRKDLAMAFLEEAKKSMPYIESLPKKNGACYLVFEKWCRGGFRRLQIDDDFDPAELGFSIDGLEMPDGTYRAVIEVTYCGEELEFESSWTTVEDLYLIGPDKKRVDFS